MSQRGIFFLIAGPAGVGKTTLLKRLVAEQTGLIKAVSVTTRKCRAGEVDGAAYHFWDEPHFTKAAAAGEFLEHAVVHNQHYGTLARFVEEKLAEGLDVIKDIDVQGVEQIRKLERFQFPNSIAIFVMPPSMDDLKVRLMVRGSEASGSLTLRLKTAEDEIARLNEYDYAVVNDSLEHGLEKLKAIRVAEHCRRERLAISADQQHTRGK